MAGSNRSGDLAHPAKSIPIGTIAAVLFTSTIYISFVFFFAATVDGRVMRDKFGKSLDDQLISSLIAWPSKWVILIGAFLSTVGAGLQSLTGAPRLLQAIAADNVVPLLRPFKIATARGEPLRAQLLTFCLCAMGVLIANLDVITPLITEFFLMCYSFVNSATCINSLLKQPSWRPSFRFYHWSLSAVGFCLCIALMFISSWYFALLAIAIAVLIYFYVIYQGARLEWGDATVGLHLSLATKSLVTLDDKPPHIKNWRPQFLVLLQVDENLRPQKEQLLDLLFEFKAAGGLTIVGTVLQGALHERMEDMKTCKNNLKSALKKKKLKGMIKVFTVTDVAQGIQYLIQTAGLGCLEHNCVLISFPSNWHLKDGEVGADDSYTKFLTVLRASSICGKAVLVPKHIELLPSIGASRQTGTVDIWWIVHDGGLLFLLAFLLTRNRIWKNCKLRIFSVAQVSDNSVEMRTYMINYVQQLRLNAEVEVVELSTGIVSAYTANRTLNLRRRQDLQNTPGLPQDPQLFLDGLREQEAGSVNPLVAAEKEKSEAAVNGHISPKKAAAKEAKRRMTSAVQLNEVIKKRSENASIIIMNMPGPHATPEQDRDYNYMEYLEALTEGLDRALLVRGSGQEVVTISQ